MVIGLEIGKLQGGGGEGVESAMPDSEKLSLFRVKGFAGYNF